jgi:hypothetical protein
MTYGRAASALVFACLTTSASAQEQSVTPTEIQETWVGKTPVGTTASGTPATIKLLSDGSASVSAGSTGDTGTWRVSNQGYCTTWRTIRAGQERCFTVKRSGTKMTVLNSDGSVSGYFTDIR